MDRASSDSPRCESRAVRGATFEETWPRYEFAELVRIGLAIGEWLANMRERRAERRRAMLGMRSPGEISPAE